MVKRPRGTLSKRSRRIKSKRRLTPKDYIKEFNIGDKVVIDIKPAYKLGGFPHPRYRGRVGTVKEKRGECYIVEIKDGRSTKQLIVHPIHLENIVVKQ